MRQFAALLARPEARTALMAVVSEATRDEPLRERIRVSIVERQKRLVLEGRVRAQARGELPATPAGRDGEADAADDLIFDVIAGTVVHRALVSGQPVDEEWIGRLTTLLLGGLGAAVGG